VVIFFPEMHQNSPIAIKDFNNFPGGETAAPPLCGRGQRREKVGRKGEEEEGPLMQIPGSGLS